MSVGEGIVVRWMVLASLFYVKCRRHEFCGCFHVTMLALKLKRTLCLCLLLTGTILIAFGDKGSLFWSYGSS